MHAVYAAFFDFREFVFIKVGRSAKPYKRVMDVAMGCPLVLSAAVFAHVGDLGKAQSIEARCQSALAEHRSRGEWFVFPKDDGSKFASVMAEAFAKVTARPLRWNKMDVEKMRQEMLDAYKSFRGGRGTKLSRAA